MLRALSYAYQLRQLQKGKRRRALHNSKLIAAEKTSEGKDRLRHDQFSDAMEYDDEIHQLQSQYLMREAEAHLVPAPKFDSKNGVWEESRFTGHWRLSAIEQAKLRTAVRAEKREKADVWFKWVASLISVLSLIVAILALCQKTIHP